MRFKGLSLHRWTGNPQNSETPRRTQNNRISGDVWNNQKTNETGTKQNGKPASLQHGGLAFSLSITCLYLVSMV